MPKAPASPKPLRVVRFPRGTTYRAISALLIREIATINSNAYGGVLWAFVQPIGGVLLLSAIFSAGFRSPPVGDVFAMFYATGIIPFSFSMSISGRLGIVVDANRRLLQYPRITVLDALTARFIFVVLLQSLVAVTVFGLILWFFDTKTILIPEIVLEALALAMVLGLGIGTLNAYLFAMFPTYQQIWGILTQPLFLLSCVFFPYESIPAPFDAWLAWNPLVHIVALSRSGFYHGYPTHHVEPLYPLFVGLGCLILGLILLNQGRGRLLTRL